MKLYRGSKGLDPAKEWEWFINNPPKVIAVDTETVSLDDRSLIGVGLSGDGSSGYYVSADDSEFWRVIALLSKQDIRKVYHNCPYDLRALRQFQVDSWNVDDTAIMARLACEVSARLEDVSFWVGKQTEPAKDLLDRYGVRSMDKLPFEIVGDKCIQDAQATFRLPGYLLPKINQQYYEWERELLPVLEVMSAVGVRLDTKLRDKLEEIYSREVAWYRLTCENLGFNPASPFQVGYFLAERGNFLPLTKSKKSLSTDNVALNKVDDPVAQIVLQFRRVSKLLSTYIVPWRGWNRAYTTFHLDAITGRVSSTSAGKNQPDRNLMNIPKRADEEFSMRGIPTIRSLFLPDDSCFTRVDASQIEIRVLAYLAQDRKMMGILDSPEGDIHLATEQEIWGTAGANRLAAKTFNFAMVFGGGPQTIADKIGSNDVQKVARLMKHWMAAYPDTAAWILRQQHEGIREGYVYTLLGRRMPIPFDMGEEHAKKCCVNYPVQGTAAEAFKFMLRESTKAGLLNSKRLQVHDEILYDGKVEVPNELEHLMPFWTPLEVEYPERWG